jgi:hypothetical protein
VLDNPSILVRDVSSTSPQAMAFDGTDFVVLSGTNAGVAGQNAIYATRVAPSGTVLDPTGIAVAPTTGSNAIATGIACNGSACLMAWQISHFPTADLIDTFVGRITSNGTLLDMPGSLVAASTAFFPNVDFDGTSYVVAYGNRTATPDAGPSSNWAYSLRSANVNASAVVGASGPVTSHRAFGRIPSIASAGRIISSRGSTGMARAHRCTRPA